MTIHDILRARLLARVTTGPVGHMRCTADELRESEWSREFEELMRVRLAMGAFRYKRLLPGVPNGYDNVGSAIERLKLYQETGNLEHLVDAANLALVEFATGQHPQRHFASADDGVHTQAVK